MPGVFSRHAFTLLELLVAVSILASLLLILFSIFNESTRAWAAAERKTDATREARAALYGIGGDLRNLRLTNLILAINRPGLNPAQEPAPGDNLFFLTTQPTGAHAGDDTGDLCLVGYYTAGDPASSGTIRRYFPGSNKTYASLMTWIDSGIVESLFPDRSATPPEEDEVLARNIANFHVRYLTAANGSYETNAALFTNAPPCQLEISLDAFPDAVARPLAGSAGGFPTNSPLYLANVRHFTTRITLESSP